MNKKTIILIISIILIVGIVLSCILIANKNNTNTDNPTEPTNSTIDTGETTPLPENPEPTNPEELLQESFIVAKEALGDFYYPSVSMDTAEVAKLLNLNSEDYSFAFGQKTADDTKLDILISIKTKDEAAGEKIQEKLFEYVDGIIANYNVSRYLEGTLDEVDMYSLEHIGEAAVPTLCRLENTGYQDDTRYAIAQIEKRRDDSIWSFTIPREIAKSSQK
jgi:flagellar basal body-associated protein FliL